MLTTQQFKTLDDLYAFYNMTLFDAYLPECIVNLSRNSKNYGFFVPNLWAPVESEEKQVHEISLNPDYLLRPSIEWHSTLVHEMVHLWQHEFGNPSRSAYHNKQWANKMDTIGLVPSDTGKEGGKRTGQKVSHYINPEGAFAKIFKSLDAKKIEQLRLRYLPTASLSNQKNVDDTDDPDGADGNGSDEGDEKKSKSGKKIKYTCDCGNNVWGKSGLKIRCNECERVFLEQE